MHVKKAPELMIDMHRSPCIQQSHAGKSTRQLLSRHTTDTAATSRARGRHAAPLRTPVSHVFNMPTMAACRAIGQETGTRRFAHSAHQTSKIMGLGVHVCVGARMIDTLDPMHHVRVVKSHARFGHLPRKRAGATRWHSCRACWKEEQGLGHRASLIHPTFASETASHHPAYSLSVLGCFHKQAPIIQHLPIGHAVGLVHIPQGAKRC
jgi:hypothetical protein